MRVGLIPRLVAGCTVLLSLCFTSAAMSDTPPAVSPEGLHLVKTPGIAVVYVKPGASLKAYDKFAILDCPVTFKEGWQREMQDDYDNPISDEQLTRIEGELSAEFKKVFVSELEAGGFQLSTTAAPDVLVLRPAIINLTIAAPENMADPSEQVFATSAGQMTLYLELYDSVTSELLARVIDPEAASDYGAFAWQSGVDNYAAADAIMKKWSDTLRKYMEAARNAAGAG